MAEIESGGEDKGLVERLMIVSWMCFFVGWGVGWYQVIGYVDVIGCGEAGKGGPWSAWAVGCSNCR